jgi:hypothetical protein
VAPVSTKWPDGCARTPYKYARDGYVKVRIKATEFAEFAGLNPTAEGYTARAAYDGLKAACDKIFEPARRQPRIKEDQATLTPLLPIPNEKLLITLAVVAITLVTNAMAQTYLGVASRMIALTRNGIRCSWPERSCGS